MSVYILRTTKIQTDWTSSTETFTILYMVIILLENKDDAGDTI